MEERDEQDKDDNDDGKRLETLEQCENYAELMTQPPSKMIIRKTGVF